MPFDFEVLTHGLKILDTLPIGEGGKVLNYNFSLLDALKGDTEAHIAATVGIHGAVSTATANRLVLRDASAGAAFGPLTATALTADTAIVPSLNIGVSSPTVAFDATSLAFFGVTPVTRAIPTADLKDALVSYGLLQNGGATPLNLDGGTLTAGAGSFTSLNVSGALTASSITDNISTQKVEVAKNNSVVGTKKRVNFIEGTNVTLDLVDQTDRVDVTINSSGSGGGGGGSSGYSGYSGQDGVIGSDGASGYSGRSGFSGYSGRSGFSGYSGAGTSGYSGYSGYSGTSGATGNSGFSGYSGQTGTAGSSGFSGYSGLTGTSGYSGYSGSNAGWSRPYLFDTLTANSDPGSGNFRFGSTITFSPLRFNDIDAGGSNNDGFFSQMNASTNAVKGYISIRRASNPLSVFAVYPVSSATDNTGWWNVIVGTPLVYNLSLGSLVAGDLYYFDFSLAGHSGESGFSGYSGSDGISGFSGYSGRSGYSGYSGSGVSGFSGYSGYSGRSGYSGYSGLRPCCNVYNVVVSGTGVDGTYTLTSDGANHWTDGSTATMSLSSGSWYLIVGTDDWVASATTNGCPPKTTTGNTSTGWAQLDSAGSITLDSCYDGASGFSGYSGYSGKSGYSGFSGYSGSGVSGFSGYSGSGYSGYSGYSGASGAVTDGTFVPLGTPTDGSWTDGLNSWTSSTTVTDALDEVNELFSYLAPADASALSGALTMSGTTLYTGYVSQGNTNYKTGLSAGSQYTIIINDPTFTLTNANTSTSFNKADEGYTKWYIAIGTSSYSSATSSVDHAANFISGSRAGTQATTPWTSGQLSVTSVAWYNSFPKWQKGNATITITSVQLSQGYNRIKMQREGTFTTQLTSDYEVFYDNDSGSNPSISGTPTVTEGATVNTRYLSGVKYYDRGTQFKVSAVALDCFDNVYVLNPVVLTSSNSNSMGNANVPWNDATVSGVSNPPAINDTMTITDKVITVPSSNVRSTNARVTVQPADPYGSYTSVQTASANRLVDGYLNDASGTSTDLGEFFDDEWYRMLSNFSLSSTSYSSGGTGGWDSSISLISGTAGYDGLQVFNGGLKYPSTNYTSGYLPSTGQVNYSSASGSRVYVRYFYVGAGVQNLTFTLSNQSGTTTFVSVATGVSGNNLTMEMLAPNTTKNGSSVVEFKDCYTAYTTDAGIGCYASGTRSSTTSNWVCSLGTKSTSTSGNVIVIRITASSSWTGVLESISVVGS